MKKLLLLALLLPLIAYAEQRTVMEYGRGATVEFELYAADGTLSVSEVDGGTEVTIVCDGDGGTTANADFVDEGFAYSLVLTAAELECAHVTLNIAATLNHAVIIETCGTPNAQHMNCAAGPYITGNTAQSGTSTTTELAAAEAFADDDLNDYLICLVEDQIAGDPRQCSIITQYVGSTDTATHQAFIGTGAASGTEYIIYPQPGVVLNVATGVVEAKVTGYDNDVIDSAATDSTYLAEINTEVTTALVDGGQVSINGTADSGTSNTLVDAAALTQADFYWNNTHILVVQFATGPEARCVRGFTASTDTLSVTPAFSQAVATEDYTLVPALTCRNFP